MPTRKMAVWAVAAALSFLSTPALPQEARSTVVGRVTDASGAVISGAVLEATNTDTGVRTSAVTNASGDFMFPYLTPGPYSLAAEAPGFKKWMRPQLQLRVAE